MKTEYICMYEAETAACGLSFSDSKSILCTYSIVLLRGYISSEYHVDSHSRVIPRKIFYASLLTPN